MNAKDLESKDHSPLRSKSKYDKFHKLFKAVPAEEYPLNDYSCAYIGDILLHGSIYISQNWICFYSKIRARGRRLQIPLEKVISITREKTALVFPNAIGVQTAEEKYTFGSFLMRDNAYKYINTVWKKSQAIRTLQNDQKIDFLREKTVLSTSVSTPVFSNGSLEIDNQFPEEAVAEDEEEEEEEEEGRSLKEIPRGHINCDKQSIQTTSSFNQNNNLILSDSSDMGLCNPCDKGESEKPDTTKSSENSKIPTSPVRKDPGKGPMIRAINIPYIIECFEVQKMMAAFSELSLKLQKIPRTNLLLVVCSVMILFLMLSAVALTYKILVLQARMEGKELWNPMAKQNWRNNMYSTFYDLRASSHLATIQQLHQVLEANLNVLEEMGLNLKALQATTGSLVKCPSQEEDCKRGKL
uniref:GRAM domain-containing protein 2B-like n=1 Tax=Crassostrea virginica TaxID=6565 RepID=A0A8B8DX36_CRAVI|nr:GRAM domain-containing protein 2B-like [Crassostrea virginica]XP_022332480.1 GRAM domain-containing protein 2B-like [Crassostrea virginica]XP_022332481.1 GRAM domain-containing protein 2B-like [Crassostrea virginica]XP_022332482.1 GRAM domain-containing protein 2B-like [Crassostrea virginica]XP_022332483.1 GRAM domain-containing protein 2B-like [Crassostrea virginica]